MYTWYVSGVAMEIHRVKLNRRGPCIAVPRDIDVYYAMAMDEYFWGQVQGYDLAE